MGASKPPKLKKQQQFVILATLGVAVVGVMGILIYLLSAVLVFGNPATPTRRVVLQLPTAVPPTATLGPPVPESVLFAVQEPIEGLSNCSRYGFRGLVKKRNGTPVQNVQIVAWDKEAGLVGLDKTDSQGRYALEIEYDAPSQRRLWVQVFRNDVPVSEAVFVTTHIDCETGFQIFRIDWQQLAN